MTDIIKDAAQQGGKWFGEQLPFVASLEPRTDRKLLGDDDFQKLSQDYQVPIAAIRAVLDVESNGGGFLSDGRPKILFEGQHFYRLTPLPVSATRPDLSYPDWDSSKYGDYQYEWRRLTDAIGFDRYNAIQSASWGMMQVMGFNHIAAGYEDLERFVDDMFKAEYYQLKAGLEFCAFNDLLRHLRGRDWASFALGYNGSGYRQNNYDTRLAQAFDAFSRVA
jgi:hypothetical protein